MLSHRAVTSLLLLILMYIVFQASDKIFVFTITCFFAVGVYELLRMYKFTELWRFIIVTIFILLSLFANFVSKFDISGTIRLFSVILWCFVVPYILCLRPLHIPKFIIGIVAIIIFLVASYSVVLLRYALGVWQLISIMSIAWIADIGAYFVGRRFGRHKLAPQISPGKSIEGAIAGLVSVIIYLLILKYFDVVIYLYSYVAVFKFGIILSAASVVGDLFESWLKRVAGVKDSGIILPGHGGVFDRVDSLIAVLALSYAMIMSLF